MKIKYILLLVMLMGVFTLLVGCRKKENPSIPQVPSEPEMTVPTELPEGVRLTGFYMNHMGMRMAPYYILKTIESGTYMKITDKSPDDYWMYGSESTEELVQPAQYFAYVDTIRDEEHASLVRLEDDTVLSRIEKCIEKYGALGWDGYDKSEAMTDVLDSGDNYNLYLELSDGTTVKMHGYNVCPKGFTELYQEVVEIFEECSDYSHYVTNNFTDSPCEYLQIELKDSEYPYVCSKLSLRKNGGEWSVLLEDEDGSVLKKGTKIADYVATGREVPFERFLNVMSQYQVEEWNGFITPGSGIGPHFSIYMWFENGTQFEARGSEFPEGYEAFKNAFVQEIYDFYMEEKAPEPRVILVNYYEATLATIGGDMHLEYVLRKTEKEDTAELEVYRGGENQEESCIRYMIPFEAVEQCFAIINKKRLHKWNEMYESGGLGGGIIVCRFIDGEKQIRVSTDCMPKNGVEILESIGHVIAGYQKEEYRVNEEQ